MRLVSFVAGLALGMVVGLVALFAAVFHVGSRS